MLKIKNSCGQAKAGRRPPARAARQPRAEVGGGKSRKTLMTCGEHLLQSRYCSVQVKNDSTCHLKGDVLAGSRPGHRRNHIRGGKKIKPERTLIVSGIAAYSSTFSAKMRISFFFFPMRQQPAVAQVGWGWGQNAVLFVCIRRKGLSRLSPIRNE